VAEPLQQGATTLQELVEPELLQQQLIQLKEPVAVEEDQLFNRLDQAEPEAAEPAVPACQEAEPFALSRQDSQSLPAGFRDRLLSTSTASSASS